MGVIGEVVRHSFMHLIFYLIGVLYGVGFHMYVVKYKDVGCKVLS